MDLVFGMEIILIGLLRVPKGLENGLETIRARIKLLQMDLELGELQLIKFLLVKQNSLMLIKHFSKPLTVIKPERMMHHLLRFLTRL